MFVKIINAIVDIWHAGVISQSLANNFAELAISFVSIIVAIISGIWSFSTSKRLKKQEAELQKQTDMANSINERLNHINNNQFDYRFEICKELSETSFFMCHYFCNYLQNILMVEEFDEENEKELFKNVENGLYSYRNTIFRSAAFLPEKVYENFMEFVGDGMAYTHILAKNRDDNFSIPFEVVDDFYKEIVDHHQRLMKLLREYLQSLAKGEDYV